MILGPFKLAIRIVSLILSLLFLYFAITFAQVWMTGREHSSNSAQAILVFGTTEDNGVPSQELTDRLDTALALFRAGRAPYIAVTGANRPGDVYTESGVSKTFLIAHGVPSSKILQGFGKDTWQNVTTVLPLLKAHSITTVLTVTDPFHEDRAMATASSQGLTPYPSPVANSPTSKDSLWLYYLKETFEVGVGRVIGFHTLSTISNSL